MDGRFFGVPRGSRQPAYYYSVPARRQPPARSPKVVSIPVHFVEPEPMRTRTRLREELAKKIQAAFRGFVVRKCVKKLDVVRREVEEIERRVCEEMGELMRSDERERLKVNEALMSLLFRLDSVRGVDAGIRDLRKRVIRKAIALQEKVDDIAAEAADFADFKDGGASEVEKSEDRGIDSPDLPGPGIEDEADADQIDKHVADLIDQGEEDRDARGEEPLNALTDRKKEGCDEADHDERIADSLNLQKGSDEAEQRNDLDIVLPNMQMEPSRIESSTESRGDASLNPESFLEEVDENTPTKEEDESEQPKSTDGNNCVANNMNEEILGRMMEDNEKMMMLMTQLFERNERQTQLLSLLSHRVERLEKAFLCEKLRRKKQRRDATDGDRLPNSNKCRKKL